MILALNCGSQSVKWKVFDSDAKEIEAGSCEIKNSRDFDSSLKSELSKIKNPDSISKVGHRIVDGGEKFSEPIEITRQAIKELSKLKSLAPLHNPFNILGIKIALDFFKKARHFGVFDTEFFAGLPEVARTYAIPRELAEKFHYKRLGFQGISHEFSSKTAADEIEADFNELKIISCHLGGGSSITAIKNGIVIDTSMGFSPMEGLVMMTRPGDLDPGIVLDLRRRFSFAKVEEILNRQSGLKGICGFDDMKDVLKNAEAGNEKSKLALDIFVYRSQKYIGAYFAVLGGCDLLVFTGAIGSGSEKIRKMITSDLNFLDNTRIFAIIPDEEKAIAQKIINL